MTDGPSDVVLAHYGVKGMRWGKRKARADSPKRLSRKEVRQINKEGQDKFYQDKAERVIKESLQKGDKVLVQVMTPGSNYPTLVTGKEFVDYAAQGGSFNMKATDIYARREGDNFILNEQANKDRYEKVKR